MYLIDTNVWIELLLGQQRAKEVKRFFQEIEASQLAITEFSLYSIGIILDRLGKSVLILYQIRSKIQALSSLGLV